MAEPACTTWPALVRNGAIEPDASRLFAPQPALALPPDEPGWCLPLALWAPERAALRGRRHPVGLVLTPADALPADLAHEALAFIAIHFAAYTDGRGFSQAQLLRRAGWTGELRATGDVLIDTVHYLARCGFDSFVPKPGHAPERVLAALAGFSASYQRAYRF
ncbi:DUF934 domain-containing protein [Derxia lacustris]|uniref:DUF934 domain-containing protein n=1 Tax=Derxia lacustris TaxID=764842 RepID=UPI000A1775B0|nr:DUF934 domain-containing protein [Derxia lacustris]